MMYFYSDWGGIVTTHSGVGKKNGFDCIRVHFERANGNGFDFMDVDLPGVIVTKAFGFSEDEIFSLKEYARNNEPLIWDFARAGGGEFA